MSKTTDIDQAYEAAQAGDQQAFAAWLGLVELPLRAALRSFAPAVDVEAVLQEGLLRMWVVRERVRLEDENASLRYALRVIRNLALGEARRLGRVSLVDLEQLEQLADDGIDPPTLPDPHLHRLIQQCIDSLPRRPREALMARLRGQGGVGDRELADQLRMKLNTFLQNIVRARKAMAECLRRGGVTIEELIP